MTADRRPLLPEPVRALPLIPPYALASFATKNGCTHPQVLPRCACRRSVRMLRRLPATHHADFYGARFQSILL